MNLLDISDKIIADEITSEVEEPALSERTHDALKPECVKMIEKKCESCGKINKSKYRLVSGDACDFCNEPLFNEYGKFANSGGNE